jgi:hypothetical protein
MAPRESIILVGRIAVRAGRLCTLIAATVLLAVPVGSPAVHAQTTGSTGAALAGGALGLYSGALLGDLGALVPCTETPAGVRCIQWVAGLGGAVGLMGGAMTGAGDSERLKHSAISAAIGFGVGGLAGMALRPVAQRVGWHDVVVMGLWGGAIGAQPMGALLGFGAGAVVGLAVWQLVPDAGFPSAVGIAALGMAMGGLVAWLEDGISAQTGPQAVPVTLLRVRF